MSLAIGNVIARIGGSSVVREYTPLNVHVPTDTTEGVQVAEVSIPAGHVLAVELDTTEPAMGLVLVTAVDDSWGEAHSSGESGSPRMTAVTAPGHVGPASIWVMVMTANAPITVTGMTTTLIPTT